MPEATVHQLHPGPPDATVMAIRGLLRARGFRSDIFLSGTDPVDGLFPASELPRHAGLVLLVHYAEAAPCPARDLARDLTGVAARKILLCRSAGPALAAAHAHYAAALAATERQSIALRRMGFAAVRTCAALFDPAAGDLGPLWRALAFAGAVPGADPRSRAAMAEAMRFTIAGHVAKTYSLAAVNRGLSRTIDAQRPGGVRLLPVEGEPTTDLSEVPAEDLAWVDALTGRHFPTGPEIVISSHYPVYVPQHRGDAVAALFYWEESLVPAATVAQLNQHFAGVLAPSGFVSRTLVNSGVTIPVLNIGQAPQLEPFTRAHRRHTGPFTFLHVSSGFPRKGLDLLLAAWPRAFPQGADVRLVIKTFPNPHNDAAARLERFRRDHPSAPPIALVDRETDQAGLATLFADADAVVLPTRGEGYNLVAAEALAAGLPLIVTAFGGHMDFCGNAPAGLVGFRFAPSQSHLAMPGSVWVEPDLTALASAMGDAVRVPWRSDAAAMLAHANPAAFVARLTDAAVELLLTRKSQPVRVAWVTPWDTGCPVAQHSRTLVAALPRDGIEPVIILCEHAAIPDAGHVQPCWHPASIAAAVRAGDADLVMIQHHPDLLGWGELADLLRDLTSPRRAVIVTLHGAPGREWQQAGIALRRAARVLVPTIAGMNALVDLGLAEAALLLEPDAPAGRLHGMMRGLVAQLRANAPLDGSLWHPASPAG